MSSVLLYDGVSGALADTSGMSSSSDALSKRLDQEYNRRLAQAVRQIGAWLVWENLSVVGGEAISSEHGTLGDVDVLAVHKSRPLAVALEAKRVKPGIGPYEIWREAEKFAGRKGYVARHSARLAWLASHTEALARLAQHSAGNQWTGRGAIAATVPLMAGYADHVVPVVSCWEAVAWLMDVEKVILGQIDPVSPTASVAWPQLGHQELNL